MSRITYQTLLNPRLLNSVFLSLAYEHWGVSEKLSVYMLIAELITVDVPYIFMRLSTSMPVHVQMQYMTSRLTNYKHWKHTTSTNLVTREWSNLWLMGCTMSAPSTPASSKDCSGAKQNSTSYPVITWKLLKKKCLGWEQFFFIFINVLHELIWVWNSRLSTWTSNKQDRQIANMKGLVSVSSNLSHLHYLQSWFGLEKKIEILKNKLRG